MKLLQAYGGISGSATESSRILAACDVNAFLLLGSRAGAKTRRLAWNGCFVWEWIKKIWSYLFRLLAKHL